MFIRVATLEDAAYLPQIEKSASELYRVIPHLAWLADGQVTTRSEHERLIRKGTVWVAEASQGSLAGFLNAEVLNRELHIWELSVHGDWQRQGVGTALLRSACQHATQTGLTSLTLTTFKDVPWCAPAYARQGFTPVKNPVLHLRDALDTEAAHGLSAERRVAMRLPITGPENRLDANTHHAGVGSASSKYTQGDDGAMAPLAVGQLRTKSHVAESRNKSGLLIQRMKSRLRFRVSTMLLSIGLLLLPWSSTLLPFPRVPPQWSRLQDFLDVLVFDVGPQLFLVAISNRRCLSYSGDLASPMAVCWSNDWGNVSLLFGCHGRSRVLTDIGNVTARVETIFITHLDKSHVHHLVQVPPCTSPQDDAGAPRRQTGPDRPDPTTEPF